MNLQSLLNKLPFKLSAGAHSDAKEGMCVMEMVSFLQGEEWTDHPECVCPVIAAFCRGINDRMPQKQRDRLQTYVLRLSGTVSKEHEHKRAIFLAMKSVNVFAAMGMDAKGFTSLANRCREAKTISEAKSAVYTATNAADAAYTANAADAVNAVYAANAAYAAAYAAANAAAYTAYADDVWEEVFKALDGVLSIGPSGLDFAPEKFTELEAVSF